MFLVIIAIVLFVCLLKTQVSRMNFIQEAKNAAATHDDDDEKIMIIASLLLSSLFFQVFFPVVPYLSCLCAPRRGPEKNSLIDRQVCKGVSGISTA